MGATNKLLIVVATLEILPARLIVVDVAPVTEGLICAY